MRHVAGRMAEAQVVQGQPVPNGSMRVRSIHAWFFRLFDLRESTLPKVSAECERLCGPFSNLHRKTRLS